MGLESVKVTVSCLVEGGRGPDTGCTAVMRAGPKESGGVDGCLVSVSW